MESIQRESNLFGLVRRVSLCVKQWHILSGVSLIASRTRPIDSVEYTLDSFQYPIRQNGLSSHTVATSFLRQFSNCSLQLLESKCDWICSNTNISENMLSPNSVIFVFGGLMQHFLPELAVCQSIWCRNTEVHNRNIHNSGIIISYLLQSLFFKIRNISIFVSNVKLYSFSINLPDQNFVCISHLCNACCMNHPFHCP